MSIYKLANISGVDKTLTLLGRSLTFPANSIVDLLTPEVNAENAPNVDMSLSDIVGSKSGAGYDPLASAVRSGFFVINDGDRNLTKEMSLSLLKYGNQPLRVNPNDGSLETRPVYCDIGWHQQFFNCTFETGTSNYWYKNVNGSTTCNGLTVTSYNSAGEVVQTGVNVRTSLPQKVHSDAVKTTWRFCPPFDYDLIAGYIYIPVSLQEGDWYIFTTALPDYDENSNHKSIQVAPGVPFNMLTHGGTPNVKFIEFITNDNARFSLGGVERFDGRSAKRLPSTIHPQLGNLGTNALEVMLEHPIGANAKFQVRLEYYKAP